MARIFLFLLGTASALLAWSLANDRRRSTKKALPAKQAAALLQDAWADYHTRA